MNILGIRRGAAYSPNLVDCDAAIFNQVADNLRAKGHEVDVISEDKMREADFGKYDRVFGMERDVKNIEDIIHSHSSDFSHPDLTQPSHTHPDHKFLNTLRGILSCSQKHIICHCMRDLNIPQPAYICHRHTHPTDVVEQADLTDLLEQTESLPINTNHLNFPVWVKNGDSCAQQASDTIYCDSAPALQKALHDLCQRNVTNIVEQEHKKGDLIKFYGVEGTDFFHWQYASQGHSKFGLEAINGTEKGIAFNSQALKAEIDRLAQHTGVPIYGGDAIIDDNGHFWIIDFNDFPSFSSCREEAAKAIAQRIER